MAKRFSFVVADPHAIVRLGVIAALRAVGGQPIETDNGREAVRLAVRHRAHLAILDVPLPRLNGIDAMHQIIESTSTRVMLLTECNDDAMFNRAMFYGVHGYLSKASPVSLLAVAARCLLSGQNWFDAAAKLYIARHAHVPKQRPLPLTDREIEVLQLIGSGWANKTVASELGMSEKTVATHRDSLMKILGCHNAADLTRYAIRTGLISAR